MIKIKNILCDVLDYAYPDSDKLGEYKRFYVEMINETRKGFHGDYHGMTHHIRIYNLYRDDKRTWRIYMEWNQQSMGKRNIRRQSGRRKEIFGKQSV